MLILPEVLYMDDWKSHVHDVWMLVGPITCRASLTGLLIQVCTMACAPILRLTGLGVLFIKLKCANTCSV